MLIMYNSIMNVYISVNPFVQLSMSNSLRLQCCSWPDFPTTAVSPGVNFLATNHYKNKFLDCPAMTDWTVLLRGNESQLTSHLIQQQCSNNSSFKHWNVFPGDMAWTLMTQTATNPITVCGSNTVNFHQLLLEVLHRLKVLMSNHGGDQVITVKASNIVCGCRNELLHTHSGSLDYCYNQIM
jgi:hypothetical protein